MTKTDEELLADFRRSGQAIDKEWEGAFLSEEIDLDGLRKIESYSNALAIYCKLLRQRLEAGQTTLKIGRAHV